MKLRPIEGLWTPIVVILALTSQASSAEDVKKSSKPQYAIDNGPSVPAASADEPLLESFSVKRAAEYLETGALAWTRDQKCVSCHTNGAYLLLRPGLTKELGPPSDEIRTFAIGAMRRLKEKPNPDGPVSVRPTQLAYIAAGLAEWDAQVIGALSPETEEALGVLFDFQSEDGSFENDDCWPPYESSAYHGATIAAMAAATAPGWLAKSKDADLQKRVDKTIQYLQTAEPPHDFGRLLLLWTATKMPALLDDEKKKSLVEMIWSHQLEDGGWSLRTFAAPEAWGSGNRTERLRADPEVNSPVSDGHQTGLAVMVLREAGVPADDPRIQKAVQWLLTHQRESGRWWTRSLNRDMQHYITYSGSAYPLLALARCGALTELP